MNNNTKFHRLTAEECREMYTSKLIDAPGYILLIIKTHGAAGWKWGISAREFCREWGVKIRTFYTAIKTLVSKGLIEAKKRSDILLSYKGEGTRDKGQGTREEVFSQSLVPSSQSLVVDITMSSVAHTYSPDCTTVQHDCIEVQHDVKTEAETVTQQEFQNPPDLIQTSSDFESEEEEEQTAPCGGAVCMEEEIKEEELTVEEIKLTEDELAIAFHEVQEGVKPSAAVVTALRETKYWTAFATIALVNGWDITLKSTQTAEQRTAIAQQLEKLKRRFRRV